MTINCIIIDDEPLARKGLREYIGDVDFLHLLAEYDTPLKVMDRLDEGQVQLIFLDIQMPKLTGLDFLKSLRNPPLVIITTAFPQYALEGFEMDVLDYLVKPIAFQRFLKAVGKAKDYYSGHGRPTVPAGESQANDYIFIKSGSTLKKIFYTDILFVEALQNYVAIHTRDKKYITYLTFKSIEENLPPADFLKVHKSYIIQLSKIEGIEGNELVIGQHSIPVSRANREAIMQRILNGKFLKR
ncbi:MAG TPA: LytTR family DNA-binding domain-containing protein [Puia sp.]|nr:LytTR family DNA-binding domain-containing protein [Puia sp.]